MRRAPYAVARAARSSRIRASRSCPRHTRPAAERCAPADTLQDLFGVSPSGTRSDRPRPAGGGSRDRPARHPGRDDGIGKRARLRDGLALERTERPFALVDEDRGDAPTGLHLDSRSVSTKARPSARASRRPTSVFPVPMKPVRMRCATSSHVRQPPRRSDHKRSAAAATQCPPRRLSVSRRRAAPRGASSRACA